MGSRTPLTKRSSAYKRLPGWKVYYGKRSSDSNLRQTPDLFTILNTNGVNELLKHTNDEHATNTGAVKTSDTADSMNLNKEVYRTTDVVERSLPMKPEYKIDLPYSVEDKYNNQRFHSDVDRYGYENTDHMIETKRSGWNAVYGKRMPGWFATYGKRDQYLNEVNGKRAPGWIATYGKRAPSSLATYDKRAPQWLATYGKRSPQWLATYGKRAPQWLATYGKRSPKWLSTYGKPRSITYLNDGILDLKDLNRYNSKTERLLRHSVQKTLSGWKVGYENGEYH